MNTIRKVLMVMMATVLTLGGVVIVSATAEAESSEPYIRMMDWNRFDILMESKTHAIATDAGTSGAGSTNSGSRRRDAHPGW